MGGFFSRQHDVITVTGLDGSGKSLCLRHLMDSAQSSHYIGHELNSMPPYTAIGVPPTLDVAKILLKFGRHEWTVWEISGKKHLRSTWPFYYGSSDAIIFVIDALDTKRGDIVRKSIQQIDETLKRKQRHPPIAIFLNSRGSSDKELEEEDEEASIATSAMTSTQLSSEDIHTQCNLQSLQELYPLKIFPVDALTGAGIKSGLEWINHQLEAI